MTLPLLAALPFIGALIVSLLPHHARRAAAWTSAAVALSACAILIVLAPQVFAGEVPRWSIQWVPALGLDFGFRLDGLAWLFALLICGIGALIVLYAAYYLDANDPGRRFFLFLLLFMGAMLGIVLADNLLLLVVFWEATSLSSFLLIGYWNHRQDARQSAHMALAITGGGGLALLGGVLLIGNIVGSFQVDAVLAAGDTIRASPLYVPTLVLVLLGAFTKSAQFPFHFWLPQAMAAPTPVSAYLHSATMVKAGVFLLARLYPALGHSEPWFWLVTLTGLATLLIGAYLAIFQHDLKGLLAYSTISHLGLIVLLFGLDQPLAIVAGVFHILNHATFKASLFMAAGIIDHETGSRDMRVLHSLRRSMPRTAALAIIASAAMAGVPLLNGFISKEMFFAEAAALERPGIMTWLLPLGAVAAGIFAVAYSARFIHDVFFNDAQNTRIPKAPHEPTRFMRAPVEVLVVICLAVGVAPAWTIGPVLAVAARATLGAPLPDYSLALWHGFNFPFFMSVVALAGGALLYFGLHRFTDMHRLIHGRRGGREMFAFVAARGLAGVRAVTAALQSGSLQQYLMLLVALAVAAGAWPFVRAGGFDWPTSAMTPVELPVAAIGLIGIAAALGTAIFHRHRLLAVTVLGAVGLVVSLLFVYLSAPDLALTQLLAEMATVILMMLALNWLPQESPPGRSDAKRAWHLALAAAAGVGIALFVFLTLIQPTESISSYFLATAVPLGGGSNVVNVILVDYRGFDTLGEITVLGVAAVTIAALLGNTRLPRSVEIQRPPATERNAHPLMLQIVARLLLPLVLLVTVHLLLRGHNLPGGGFIAGLVIALALILLSVAQGVEWVDARMKGRYLIWTATGMLLAAATGIGSWAVAHPFLTSTYTYLMVPWIGAVPLASAALFDLGVFLTTVGAVMVMLTSLGRLSQTRKGAV
ncbi:MAG: monovalent cation/H+ antiporter subunit A [Proteobacteria bacterium]|nr:monovalent cation/H+ antiporter subunit A [Burkholderiales bacterium]